MRLKSPFTRIETIDTCISSREAMDRVKAALTGDRALHISEITENDQELFFSMVHRLGDYQNSFLPRVCVRFSDTQSGSRVQIECRVRPAVRIVFFCLMASSVLSVLHLLLRYFLQFTDSILLCLVPLAIIPFLYFLSLFGLRLGSNDAIYVIRKALLSE